MKIQFEKELLIAAVTPAMSAVSAKNTIAAIEGILFRTEGSDRCELSTYDLDKGFQMTIPCQVREQGSAIINAGKLFRIIRMMPDRFITVTVEEKGVAKISSGHSEFCLPALGGENFPNLPLLHSEKGITMKQRVLKKTVNQVLHAISTDELRPVLCGAFFRVQGNTLRVVASDLNRLALRERECGIVAKGMEEGSALSFIVPGKSLSELLKMLDGEGEEEITLEFGRRHVIFCFQDKVFFSRLIDGEYIEIDRVIPTGNRIRVKLEREELLECLERASLVSDDKTMGQVGSYVKCRFLDGRLEISSSSSLSSVYDEVAIEKEGEDITIGFNCRFLLDALRAITDEKILITLSTPLMSITMEKAEPPVENSDAAADEEQPEEDDGKYLYLIGPVRMKE